jgi:hypothetical protein
MILHLISTEKSLKWKETFPCQCREKLNRTKDPNAVPNPDPDLGVKIYFSFEKVIRSSYSELLVLVKLILKIWLKFCTLTAYSSCQLRQFSTFFKGGVYIGARALLT